MRHQELCLILQLYAQGGSHEHWPQPSSARNGKHSPSLTQPQILPSHAPRGSDLDFRFAVVSRRQSTLLGQPVIWSSLTTRGNLVSTMQWPYPSWSFIWNCLKGTRGSRRSWGRGKDPRSTGPWFSDDCGEHI